VSNFESGSKLEDASFQILDLELKQKEREILEEWVERKKSSSLWKLFSALANLEWGLKNHVRAWKRGPTLARTSPKNGD
jgi:hypothetical protein